MAYAVSFLFTRLDGDAMAARRSITRPRRIRGVLLSLFELMVVTLFLFVLIAPLAACDRTASP